MKSVENGRVVLVDENEMVGRTMKAYLEKSFSRPIATLHSIEDMDDGRYDVVLLNLSYYHSHQKIVEAIGKVQTHDFNRLIVFSNLCLYKNYPILGDRRVTVLCRRSLWSFRDSTLNIRIGDLPCSQECDGFEAPPSIPNEMQGKQLESLSEREKEILVLIGRGLSSKEIAARLYISKRTVDHHRENISRKLNLNGLSQIIGLALYFLGTIME